MPTRWSVTFGTRMPVTSGQAWLARATILKTRTRAFKTLKQRPPSPQISLQQPSQSQRPSLNHQAYLIDVAFVGLGPPNLRSMPFKREKFPDSGDNGFKGQRLNDYRAGCNSSFSFASCILGLCPGGFLWINFVRPSQRKPHHINQSATFTGVQ